MMLSTVAIVFSLWAQAAPVASPVAQATPKPAPRGPVVVLTTTLGRIRVGLHQDKAPISVKNFLLYVRGGEFDHTIFHRVIPGFMIQGGGYEADLTAHPTHAPIRNESLNGLSNLRGTLALARTQDPHSATAQFFINLKDNTRLDGRPGRAGYTVFGEVLEGLDVVDKIAAVPTETRGIHANVPITPVEILKARLETPRAAARAR